MRIAHLTDPHLTSLSTVSPFKLAGKRRLGYLSWRYKRRQEHCTTMLAEIQSAIAAEAPDVIVVTGDLVHIGLAEEIASAARWLEELNAISPLVLVPGNHDCYANDTITHMHQQWSRFLNVDAGGRESFPSLFQNGRFSIIGLSSALPMPFWSAGGLIGKTQLSGLERILDETPNAFRCIALHHPPVPGQIQRRKALADADSLHQLILRHGIELVLHGHVHRNQELLIGGRTRIMASASASKATKINRASFRLFDIAPDRDAWQVHATLKSIDDSGQAISLSQQVWRVAQNND